MRCGVNENGKTKSILDFGRTPYTDSSWKSCRYIIKRGSLDPAGQD